MEIDIFAIDLSIIFWAFVYAGSIIVILYCFKQILNRVAHRNMEGYIEYVKLLISGIAGGGVFWILDRSWDRVPNIQNIIELPITIFFILIFILFLELLYTKALRIEEELQMKK